MATSDTGNNICSICITPIGTTNVCTLDCGHSFHYNCLFRWNSHHQTCPMCRNEVDIEPRSQQESQIQEIQQNLETMIHFRDIVNNSNQRGFKLQCKECETFLVECHHCKEKMCQCVSSHYNRQYDYFNMKNPFSSNDSQIFTCGSCFFERDSIVLEHLNSPNVNLDEYLYNHNFESIGDDPYIKELYEAYYVNNSDIEYNTQVYGNNFREYRDYESFISYIEMIHEHEIHRENWNTISNPENSNEISSSIPNIDNVEDIYNYLFMNIPNMSNIPRNTPNMSNIPRNTPNMSNVSTSDTHIINYIYN